MNMMKPTSKLPRIFGQDMLVLNNSFKVSDVSVLVAESVVSSFHPRR